MKRLREYIRKDLYCRILLVLLILVGIIEFITGNYFEVIRPILSFLFVLLGIRLLQNKELMEETRVTGVVYILIIGYAFDMMWHIFSLING